MTDDRSAIGARRDQVAAFDRPERLNTGLDIREAVNAVRETSDLWKVYAPQWLVVYTSRAGGAAGEAECHEYFTHTYFERVRDTDVRYESTWPTDPEPYPWRLLLQLPTVVGEFKHREAADAFVIENKITDTATVVTRNSRDEFKLREYGKKKLPASER